VLYLITSDYSSIYSVVFYVFWPETQKPTLVKMNQVNQENKSNVTPSLRFGSSCLLNIRKQIFSTVLNFARENLIIRRKFVPQSGNIDAPQTKDIVTHSMEEGAHIMGDTTKSANNADIAISTPANRKDIRHLLISDNTDGHHSSLEQFLAKPQTFATGVFATTDGPTTFGVGDIFGCLTNPLCQDKLRGFYGFRATTVITIEFNANRFQQGRYILAYLSTGGMPQGTTVFNDWYIAHRYSRETITQLPHVEFDLATDTSAQIRIPYVSSTLMCPVSAGMGLAGEGSPGVYFIYPYSPLIAVSGSTTAPYTVWGHYEDVELFSSTVPQMAWEPQAKGKGRAKIDLIDSEAREKGMVSSKFRMIADVSAAMNTVPFLSSMAGPISYVSDALARAAASWGWSKPAQVQPTVRVKRLFSEHMAATNTPIISEVLSHDVTNHVEILPGFAGNDNDEMSIDYLKSIPVHMFSFIWPSIGAPHGTSFGPIEVGPNAFRTLYNAGTEQLIAFTPISLFQELFDQWRGGFIYTFKFVKTEFHSGRLAISYVPFNQNFTPTLSFANTHYVHREIIDLRESNEFTFHVPFVSHHQWLFTGHTNRKEQKCGWLMIHVVDPLNHPATVSNTIDVLVQGRGAPDLQFAVPSSFRFTPAVPLIFQSGWEPQGADGTISDPSVNDDSAIGASVMKIQNFDHASSCIGEVMTSLRQILKRGSALDFTLTPAGSTPRIYMPLLNWVRIQSVGAPLGNQCSDIYNAIVSCYALSRGGHRAILCAQSPSNECVFRASLWNGSPGETASAVYSNPSVSGAVWNFSTSGLGQTVHQTGFGNLVVDIPQYMPRHSRNTMAQIATNMYPVFMTDTSMSDRNFVQVRISGTTVRVCDLTRAVADDFNVGGFVSIPPMWRASAV
jgi:hypothetical protein